MLASTRGWTLNHSNQRKRQLGFLILRSSMVKAWICCIKALTLPTAACMETANPITPGNRRISVSPIVLIRAGCWRRSETFANEYACLGVIWRSQKITSDTRLVSIVTAHCSFLFCI